MTQSSDDDDVMNQSSDLEYRLRISPYSFTVECIRRCDGERIAFVGFPFNQYVCKEFARENALYMLKQLQG